MSVLDMSLKINDIRLQIQVANEYSGRNWPCCNMITIMHRWQLFCSFYMGDTAVPFVHSVLNMKLCSCETHCLFAYIGYICLGLEIRYWFLLALRSSCVVFSITVDYISKSYKTGDEYHDQSILFHWFNFLKFHWCRPFWLDISIILMVKNCTVKPSLDMAIIPVYYPYALLCHRV